MTWNTSEDPGLEKILGRADRWPNELPGLHLEFAAATCTCVFDYEAVPIGVGEVDPADVYGSVYRSFRTKLCEAFASRRRETDRGGSRADCERMAEKAARKCEANELFLTWLVLSV